MVDIPGTMVRRLLVFDRSILSYPQDTEVARAEVSKCWMTKFTSPLILASCDRAVDSLDVSDRIGDILWHDRMTGTSSRSVNRDRLPSASNICRIMIILTQIDKGTKEEGEKHVADDAGYTSLRSQLIEAETELELLKARDRVQEAALRQLQAVNTACSSFLFSAVTGTPVAKPSWWSQITVPGWAGQPLVIFGPGDDGANISSTNLEKEDIVVMMQHLSASMEETSHLPKSSELASRVRDLKQEMHRKRTDAKVAAIRRRMIDKIAAKMAEQASRLSQDRGDDDFDLDSMQPAAFRELAEETTTVVGVCPPAAAAVRARNAGKEADARYDEWLDEESTGIASLEHLLKTLVNDTVLSHEMACVRRIRDGLLDVLIMSSSDKELLNGEWWPSEGDRLCNGIAEVGLSPDSSTRRID